MCIRRRSITAVFGGFTPTMASQAFAEAKQVADWADAAGTRGYAWHFVEGSAFGELFEASEVHDFEERFLYCVVIV